MRGAYDRDLEIPLKFEFDSGFIIEFQTNVAGLNIYSPDRESEDMFVQTELQAVLAFLCIEADVFYL
jgi:hypothetical protein